MYESHFVFCLLDDYLLTINYLFVSTLAHEISIEMFLVGKYIGIFDNA